MKNSLAIVIPAYKIDYFENVLKSLSSQTCKDFNVYIGIDASPYDFESIISKYKGKINLLYKRFNINFGGKDLVSHWNRCLDLIRDEEWIWLFSDDDLLDNNCVESFYSQLKNDDSFDLYHFTVDIINADNKIIKSLTSFPDVLPSLTYLKQKSAAKINSFVVDFIFRRSTFVNLGGFQKFDLAWGSDVATWAKLGRNSGIKTIHSAKVKWRSSGINITTVYKKESLLRKLSANVEFFKWCKSYFPEISYSEIYYYMFRIIFHYTPYLTRDDFYSIVYPLYAETWYGRFIINYSKKCYKTLRLINKSLHYLRN